MNDLRTEFEAELIRLVKTINNHEDTILVLVTAHNKLTDRVKTLEEGGPPSAPQQ